MRICSYCGKTYPDGVTVCPEDGHSLSGPTATRKKVSGVWRGCYGYGPRGESLGYKSVTFTWRLKQGWTSHFTGEVTDDDSAGQQGVGKVDGYFAFPEFELTKQMPVAWVLAANASLQTLRQYLAERGMETGRDFPGPPILYQGHFLDAHRVQGTWLILPRIVPLGDSKTFPMPGSAGYWCATFVSEKTDGPTIGGPKSELFDKTKLTADEVEMVEPLPMRCLGEFPAAVAEQWSTRLVAAGLEVSLGIVKAGQDEQGETDGPMRVYVRAEDEETARKIMGPSAAKLPDV